MPRRFLFIAMLAGAIGGGVWFQRNFEVHGLDQVTITRRGAVATVDAPQTTTVPVAANAGGTIRIASFNIQVFGESKLAKPQVMQILAQVIRRFDVVAIQEVRATTQDVLPRFLQMINAEGASYDFVIGPRLGRTSSKEQYAFIYNRATIELVPGSMYTVDDPDDRLHREPMVAGFTVRGPPPAQAFTFTLIDIHTDPDEVASEMNALDDVYRAVRDDGRHEDDIILLGDLNTDDAPSRRTRTDAVPDRGHLEAALEHPRQQIVRQHHLRSPRHDRIHGPLGRAEPDARIPALDAGRPGSLGPLPRMGRVQRLRRGPARRCGGQCARRRAGAVADRR